MPDLTYARQLFNAAVTPAAVLAAEPGPLKQRELSSGGLGRRRDGNPPAPVRQPALTSAWFRS